MSPRAQSICIRMPSWPTWLPHWIQRPSRCRVSGRPHHLLPACHTESQPEQPHEVPTVPPAPQRVYVRHTAPPVPPMPFRPCSPSIAVHFCSTRSPWQATICAPGFSLAAPTSTVAPPVAAPTSHPPLAAPRMYQYRPPQRPFQYISPLYSPPAQPVPPPAAAPRAHTPRAHPPRSVAQGVPSFASLSQPASAWAQPSQPGDLHGGDEALIALLVRKRPGRPKGAPNKKGKAQKLPGRRGRPRRALGTGRGAVSQLVGAGVVGLACLGADAEADWEDEDDESSPSDTQPMPVPDRQRYRLRESALGPELSPEHSSESEPEH
ncbi:hypothetical protein O6H91_Y211000 [Diphasiastrum complanatum]|nr:hypothetical protein O6H91_Y211000 [Diphasiastrum complanatum]